MPRLPSRVGSLALLAVLGALAGCDTPVPGTTASGLPISAEAEAGTFGDVIARVEPVAERECRARTFAKNCDFVILVDKDPASGVNAFQSIDRKSGRPFIIFTAGMIATARNPDELAFVLGHEAAHHILGHLELQQRNAEVGAEIFADLATLTGGSGADVKSAKELGALVGARAYSKEFELEADKLGTVITYRAGYDPRLGAAFFFRIPDPGDQFLGTHPPNEARRAAVEATIESL